MARQHGQRRNRRKGSGAHDQLGGGTGVPPEEGGGTRLLEKIRVSTTSSRATNAGNTLANNNFHGK